MNETDWEEMEKIMKKEGEKENVKIFMKIRGLKMNNTTNIIMILLDINYFNYRKNNYHSNNYLKFKQ